MEKVRHLAWRCKGWVLSTFGGPKENGTSCFLTLKPPCEGKRLPVYPHCGHSLPHCPSKHKCSFPSFPGCSYPQSVSPDLQGLCLFFFGKHRGFTSETCCYLAGVLLVVSLDKIPNTACRHAPSPPTSHKSG